MSAAEYGMTRHNNQVNKWFKLQIIFNDCKYSEQHLSQ